MSEINDILEKIQTGEVSPEEAVELIENLKNNGSKPVPKKSTMDILKSIESGDLSAADGIKIMKSAKAEYNQEEKSPPVSLPSDEEIKRFEKWWRYPWIIGLVIFIGTGLGMNSIVHDPGINFWFFLLIIPLLLGLLILLVTWPSENKAWVHVRVKNTKDDHPNVKISIPLPMVFTSWALKIGKNFIPIEISEKLDVETIELLFDEIKNGKKAGNPFHVHVDEGDGEIVDVYIG
jgi:hypothetical protein